MFGWLSPAILAAFGVFGISLAAFGVAESRHPDPLLPAQLIRRPALRTAGSVNLLLGLWNGGEMLVLSLYFQQVLRDSPLATGLAIAPQGIIGFTAGAFGARLAGRIGIRRVLVLTGAVATAGFVVLTQLPADGHYGPVLAAVMLVGFGTAGTAFGTMVIATAGVPGAEQGVVGGVINTSRQVGAALGAATLPAIAAAVGHDTVTATAAGTRAAMLAGAAAAGVATVISWRAIRVSRTALQPQAADYHHHDRNRRERHAVHNSRPHRPSGLPDRLRHLATRRGLGPDRRVGRDHGHPASRRSGRHPVRHRSGLRL